MSQFRPQCPIVAISRNERTVSQLLLSRSCMPLLYTNKPTNQSWNKDVDDRVDFTVKYAYNEGLIAQGDQIIVLTGWSSGPSHNNVLRILTVGTNILI